MTLLRLPSPCLESNNEHLLLLFGFSRIVRLRIVAFCACIVTDGEDEEIPSNPLDSKQKPENTNNLVPYFTFDMRYQP